MSRRSRRRSDSDRRYDRAGEPYYRSSRQDRLPRPDDVDPDPLDLFGRSGARPGLVSGGMGQRPITARPGGARRSSVRTFNPPPLTKQPSPNRPFDPFAALRVVRMAAPKRVLFCVARKARREVMFALRVAGKRGVGKGGVRRTPESYYSCEPKRRR